MGKVAKWLTEGVVVVRLVLVVLSALAGAMADAGLTGGQVGAALVRSASSFNLSAAQPAALLYQPRHSVRRLIA